MPGLVPKILIDSVWVEMGSRVDDVIGAPVTAEPSLDGRAISDEYTLTFSSVDPGVSATVSVSAASGSVNPYHGGSFSVDLDAATEYTEVVPGATLVFSNDAGFDDTWSSVVILGLPFGFVNAFPPDAGSPGGQTRIQVENTGADDGVNCVVRVLPNLKRVKKVGQVIAILRPFSEDAVMKLSSGVASPYLIEVSNVSGSGASKTMDIDVDGAPIDVVNLTTGVEGTSTGLNVVDYYRVTSSGGLEGAEFILSQAAVNSDQENVLVFDNDVIEIAPDVSGAPGSWGTTDVDLTEDGQSTGVIRDSQVAYFWVRRLVSEFGNKVSNPYICSPAIQGAALSAAGWTS